MAQAPAVSVLIPVYNREGLLGPCIESALAQTVTDIEVIVCDNASADDTWAVCEQYAARDSRVRIHRNAKNLGPVGNWLACLERAQAPLVKLLFSDDLLKPDYLERTSRLMQTPDLGFVFTAAEFVDGDQHGIGTPAYAMNHWPEQVDSAEYLKTAIQGSGLPLSPGAALFRTDDLRRSLLPELQGVRVNEFTQTGAGIDLLCFLLTAQRYPRIAHIAEPLTQFREHPGSISSSRAGLVRAQYLEARIWFCKQHAPEHLSELLAEAWWVHELGCGRWQSFAALRKDYGLRPDQARMGAKAWRMALRFVSRQLRGKNARLKEQHG